MNHSVFGFVCGLICILPLQAQTQSSMRNPRAISQPVDKKGAVAVDRLTGISVEPPVLLTSDLIDDVRTELERRWTQKDISGLFSDDYHRSSDVLSALSLTEFRNARLDIQDVSRATILEQKISRQEQGVVRTSVTEIIFRTQIEIVDAENGIVLVPGENRVLMEIDERLGQ